MASGRITLCASGKASLTAGGKGKLCCGPFYPLTPCAEIEAQCACDAGWKPPTSYTVDVVNIQAGTCGTVGSPPPNSIWLNNSIPASFTLLTGRNRVGEGVCGGAADSDLSEVPTGIVTRRQYDGSNCTGTYTDYPPTGSSRIIALLRFLTYPDPDAGDVIFNLSTAQNGSILMGQGAFGNCFEPFFIPAILPWRSVTGPFFGADGFVITPHGAAYQTKCPGGDVMYVDNDLSEHVGEVRNIGGVCFTIGAATTPPEGAEVVTLTDIGTLSEEGCTGCCAWED